MKKNTKGKSPDCAWHQDDSQHLGYSQWHFKALESQRKGLKQKLCLGCLRWFWPWEQAGA